MPTQQETTIFGPKPQQITQAADLLAKNKLMITFGPIPSRRLGQSLGINHIPPKACTYDCIYCQVGETTDSSRQRRVFFPPEEVIQEVEQRVANIRSAGGHIDYLSFVPDGEPTLDLHLGRMIEGLRRLDIPIAVFTNSTLMDQPAVREELALADWVSLKVDAIDLPSWRRINRPNKQLDLPALLDGLKTFAAAFRGEVTTETMLVQNINDQVENLQAIADFLPQLQPAIAYLGVPTRPPALSWVQPPSEEKLHEAYQLLAPRLPRVEYLIGYADSAFQPSGNAREDILQITAVHPLRESEARKFLEQDGSSVRLLDQLVAEDLLKRVEHEGASWYVRRFLLAEPA